MAEKILVPLKRHDRVEEVVPYIERVTRPGMGVVFLIHHPVSGLKWLQAYCGIMECGLDNALMLRKMMESYAVKTRRQLAEQKVFQTCQGLHRLGVKTAVEVYSGSLTKNLKSYVSKGDAQLVLVRSGMGQGIKSFLRRTLSLCGLFQPPAYRSVLLLYPRT
ncbi:MAG TPA: hypothetical protein VF819_12265 [Nitrospira sp.]